MILIYLLGSFVRQLNGKFSQMLVIERKTSVFTEIESYSLPIQLKSFHWFIINERALSQELCMLLISDRLRSPICRINLLSHSLNSPKQRMTDKFPSPPILIATPFPASFTWIARLKQNVNKSITNRFSLIISVGCTLYDDFYQLNFNLFRICAWLPFPFRPPVLLFRSQSPTNLW